jgi:hypothetical protein
LKYKADLSSKFAKLPTTSPSQVQSVKMYGAAIWFLQAYQAGGNSTFATPGLSNQSNRLSGTDTE